MLAIDHLGNSPAMSKNAATFRGGGGKSSRLDVMAPVNRFRHLNRRPGIC